MNRGFHYEREIAEQSETDWVFGAASPLCIALIPELDRVKYLPKGEVQRGLEDFMDCAGRGPNNELEAKFTFLIRNGKLTDANLEWLYENGYIVLEDV